MTTEDKGKLHAVLRLKDGARLEVRDAFEMGLAPSVCHQTRITCVTASG